MPALRMRKLADKSQGRRETRYDELTGEKKLVNPDTPGTDHEPWPLAGIELLDDPTTVQIPHTTVQDGRKEGWLVVEGEDVQYMPAGPPDNPHSIPPHVFVKLEFVTFKTANEGDVRFRVTHNPGKYDDPNEPSGKRIDWYYELVRMQDNDKATEGVDVKAKEGRKRG